MGYTGTGRSGILLSNAPVFRTALIELREENP